MASPFEARLGLLNCAGRAGSTLHRGLPLLLGWLPLCYALPFATGPVPLSLFMPCSPSRPSFPPRVVPGGQSPPFAFLALC
eukprot:7234326-Heterocapsa_arctica.AAC.1